MRIRGWPGSRDRTIIILKNSGFSYEEVADFGPDRTGHGLIFSGLRNGWENTGNRRTMTNELKNDLYRSNAFVANLLSEENNQFQRTHSRM